MLTGVVAVLLALSAAAAPSAGVAPAAIASHPELTSAQAISVSMTTHNDGHAVSLLDAAHPAWAHLAPTGAVAEVTVAVALHGTSIHRWVAHLETPDAFQGVTPADCRGDEEAPPREVSCDFAVQAASGVNRLLFRFSADDGRVTVDARGTITGGQFNWDAGWQVLDATGQWSAVSRAPSIALPATLTSALRYVVTNTGDVPFRASNGCEHRLVASHAQLVCLVRGVRPVQSLARSYHEQLRLVDVVGATAEPDIQTSIRSFAGVFSLAAPSATVGQQVIVRASGLPSNAAFGLQYRIDDEPVLVGAGAARAGKARLSFPLPSTAVGTAHVEVIHDGLTIASLPFEVTLVPRKMDAAPPGWPWLLLVVPPVGLLAALLLLGRRRRRRALTESREPPDPDPYQDATRARPEPAVARPW